MKTILVLATVVVAAYAIPADTYDPAFDNFDITEFRSVRALTHFGNCFADKGPCTAEGNKIKKVLGEAMSTKCAKCTPKQRHLAREVIGAFKTKTPELWQEIVNKYDPKGEHIESFNEFLAGSD